MQPSSRHLLPSAFCLLFVAFCLLPAAAVPAAENTATDIKVWPLFYHASDPVTKDTRTEVFWPLYARQKTNAYTVNQFLSFPQRYPEQYPSQFYLLWPLGGLRSGHGHDAWLFPFLWSSDEHFVIFPVFWYGDDDFSIFPLFYASGDADGHTLNIAVLQHNYWKTTPDNQEHLHALWPLLWYWTDRRRQPAEPFSSDTLHVGLLPLFFHGRHDSSSATGSSTSNYGDVLLLNWWNRSQSHSIENDGATSARRSASNGLFPLWWDWREGKTKFDTRKTPLQNTAVSGHLLFPFWWASVRTEKGDVAESAKFLVPIGAHFFKQHEYDTQNLLGPVLNRTANTREKYVRYDALFPVFSLTTGQTRSGGHVFPFVGWETRRGKDSNLWYLFPLGWRCETQEDGRYRVNNDARFWALHELESKPFINNTDCTTGPRRTVAFYPFAWSARQADKQENGLLPFWWRETQRGGPNVSTNTWFLPLLGSFDTTERDGKRTYTRQDYLLSILAWGRGEQYQLRRFFPLYSCENNCGRRKIWSLLLPFYYETWHDQKKPELRNSSELAIPFAFLPLYGSRSNRNGADSATANSWLFPFYKHSTEKSAARDVQKISILWPFWNGEWENGETRIRGLGGMTNFYEKDANGFVEQRLLYRLFTRRTRSWFAERELMPFYSAQSREGGAGYWKLLGGLCGAETRDNGAGYFRLLYIPIPAGQSARPDAAALARGREKHAQLALNYLKHNRYDRAAIEVALAGSARAADRDFQLAAAEAYLAAGAEAVGQELRSSIPSSLEPLGGKGGYCDSTAVHQNLRTLAVKHFAAAITLGADQPNTLRQMACAYADMGDNDTALRKLTEADTLRPAFVTGMERLGLAIRLWNIHDNNEARRETTLQQALSILAALWRRYPESPTLCLREAELPEKDGRSDKALPYTGHMSREAAFARDATRRLALYERGAVLNPGREETDMTSASCRRHSGNALSTPAENPPAKCAEHALTILNQQTAFLLDDQKTAEAEALFPRIRKLLPRACLSCGKPADPDNQSDLYSYNSPVSSAMHNLYRLHLDLKKDLPGYVATAKEWAATLCPHQQQAVVAALASVRFEQQYLREWRVTLTARQSAPPAPPKNLEKNVHLNFFERYVNLDAILGGPDHCTATAECVITSPEERQAVLRLGFDHELTAELNGAVIFGPQARKIAVRDEFTIPVTLKKGANRLKLTVADDTLAYGFFARLSDNDGKFMEDVAVSAK